MSGHAVESVNWIPALEAENTAAPAIDNTFPGLEVRLLALIVPSYDGGTPTDPYPRVSTAHSGRKPPTPS